MKSLVKDLVIAGLSVIAMVGCRSTETRVAAKASLPVGVVLKGPTPQDGDIQLASYEEEAPTLDESSQNPSPPKSGGINYSGTGTKSAPAATARPGKC